MALNNPGLIIIPKLHNHNAGASGHDVLFGSWCFTYKTLDFHTFYTRLVQLCLFRVKHSATYTDSDGATVSEMNSRYGDTCHGHGGSDVFPFGLLDTDTDGFEVSGPCIDLQPILICTREHPRWLWRKNHVQP